MAMSDEHKAALAEGRRQARAIKAYLMMNADRKPGRPVNAESTWKRIKTLDERLEREADLLRRVEIVQKKLDAEQTLRGLESASNAAALEAGFVEHAKAYSERKGLSYNAWRESGVPASMLRRAEIPETRRR